MARRDYEATGKIEGNVFERACEGKVAYPSEASARAGLRFLEREGTVRTNGGMVVYECRFCRQFHFGH